MTDLKLTHVPSANTGMLIRKPVAEVFEAFINPDHNQVLVQSRKRADRSPKGVVEH